MTLTRFGYHVNTQMYGNVFNKCWIRTDCVTEQKTFQNVRVGKLSRLEPRNGHAATTSTVVRVHTTVYLLAPTDIAVPLLVCLFAVGCSLVLCNSWQFVILKISAKFNASAGPVAANVRCLVVSFIKCMVLWWHVVLFSFSLVQFLLFSIDLYGIIGEHRCQLHWHRFDRQPVHKSNQVLFSSKK